MRRQERHLERHDHRVRDDGRMAISICLYGLSLMAVMAYVWVNPPSRHHNGANGPDLIRLASDASYTN